jgi:hypothetical protein
VVVRQIETPEMICDSVYEGQSPAVGNMIVEGLLDSFLKSNLIADARHTTAITKAMEILVATRRFFEIQNLYKKIYCYVSDIITYLDYGTGKWRTGYALDLDVILNFEQRQKLFNLIDLTLPIICGNGCNCARFSERSNKAYRICYNVVQYGKESQFTKELAIAITCTFTDNGNSLSSSLIDGNSAQLLAECYANLAYTQTQSACTNKDFINKAIDSGNAFVIPCGWPTHCVYMYVRKCNNLDNTKNGVADERYIVQECNLGAGCPTPSEYTLYSSYGKPGRALIFRNKKELMDFVIDVFHLNSFGKQEDYERYLGSLQAPDSNMTFPWAILQRIPLQRCGDCVMRSTAMACWVAFLDQYGSSNPDEIKKLLPLLHLLEIHSRFTVIKKFFEEFRDEQSNLQSPADREGRLKILDRLRLLRYGSGRLFHHMDRYFSNEENSNSSYAAILLENATELNAAISEFLSANPADQLACDGGVEIFSQRLGWESRFIICNMQRFYRREDCKNALETATRKKINFDAIGGSINGAVEALEVFITTNRKDFIETGEGKELLQREPIAYGVALHRLAKIMHRIPFPSDLEAFSAWRKGTTKVINELALKIQEIMHFLSASTVMGQYLFYNSEKIYTLSNAIVPQTMREQLLVEKHLNFQPAEALPLLNIVAKMRIITWQLGKLNPEMLKEQGVKTGPNFTGLYLDQRWYTSFCLSPLSFPQTQEEAEERRKILTFTFEEKKQNTTPIFDYESKLSMQYEETTSWPVAKFYNACLLRSTISSLKRTIADGYSSCRDACDEVVGAFFFGVAWYCGDVIISSFNKCGPSFLRAFKKIMSYGGHVYGLCPYTSITSDITAPLFTDSLKRVYYNGGSYDAELVANDAENVRRSKRAESSASIRRRCIDIALSYEKGKAIGMLHFFGENFSMCAGFRKIGASAKENDPLLDLYFWEQTFCHGIQAQMPSPLEMDALERTGELLTASDTLLDKGLRYFWKDQPNNKPDVPSLAVVFHVKHMAQRKVIQEKENQIQVARIKSNIGERIKTLKEIQRMCDDSDSTDAKYLLYLVFNECYLEMFELSKRGDFAEEVQDEYAKELMLNATRLLSFNPAGLMKGFFYALRGFLPTLEKYWELHSTHALAVAEFIYKKVALDDFTYTHTSTAESHCIVKNSCSSVDLLTLRILRNGNRVSLNFQLFDQKDYQRLFLNRQREMSVAGNSMRFIDNLTGYGEIEILEVKVFGTVDTKEIQIYRTINNRQWRYVAPEKIDEAIASNMSWCHGNDFTVWIDGTGKILIYARDNPNKLIFEADDTKRLKSLRPEDNGYYVDLPRVKSQFSDPSAVERFEPIGCQLILRDDHDELKEIVFPRYRSEVGQELRLVAVYNSGKMELFLKENPKFKLIAAPVGATNPEWNRGNPILGYDCALWFTNVDARNGGTYKAILPAVKIEREEKVGISHAITFTRLADYGSDFFGSARTAELSFFENPLDFVAPNLKPTNLLASLRLAHAFQTQSEYERALEVLRSFSSPTSLDAFEFAEFESIILWFQNGHEQSPQAAFVVAAALSRLLQIAATDPRTGMLVKVFCGENWKSLGEYLGQLFAGVDQSTPTLRMSFREERLMWLIFQMLGIKHWKIEKRLKDLKNLMQRQKKVAKAKQSTADGPTVDVIAENRLEVGRRKLFKCFTATDDQAIVREDAGLPFLFVPLMEPNTTGAHHTFFVNKNLQYVGEEELRKLAEEKIDGKIFEIPGTNDVDGSDAPQLDRGQIATSDRRQLQGDFDKLIGSFNGEMELGARQLAALRRDKFLTATLDEKSQISISGKAITQQSIDALLTTTSRAMKKATDAAKAALQEVQRIANAGFFLATRGSGAWEQQNLPPLLRRVYGTTIAGHRDRAMRYMVERHPGFPREQLDPLLLATEEYLIAVTTLRYLRRLFGALDQVLRETDGPRKLSLWANAVTLIRELRSSFPDSFLDQEGELQRMALLFEYMCQIRPRLDQIEKIRFILQHIKDKDSGALIQQIMGSGKSKVLTPFFILLISLRGDMLPVLVSHISQLPAVFKEMSQILSSIDMYLDPIEYSFNELDDTNGVSILHKRLKNALPAGNCVPLFTSQTIMAFKAFQRRSRYLNSSEHEAMCRQLAKLSRFFSQKCIALLDEVHLTEDPTESYIIQHAMTYESMQKIPEEHVDFLVMFMHRLPPKILLAIKHNQQDQLPPPELRQSLEEHIQNVYLLGFFPDGNSEDLEQSFIAFILGDLDGTDTNTPLCLKQFKEKLPELRIHLGTLSNEMQTQAALLHFFCVHLLPSCFGKKYLDDFGYNAEGIAVPYYNRLPTQSYFQSPMETLFYLNLCIIADGISDAAIRSFVEGLADSAKTQRTSAVDFNSTSSAVYFANFFSKISNNPPLTLGAAIDENFKVRPEAAALISKFLKEPGRSFERQQMAVVISKAHSSFCAQSFSATPQVLPSIFRASVGLTGTTFNRNVYPVPLSVELNLSPQEGSLGQVAVKFCQDIEAGLSRILAPTTEQLQGVTSTTAADPSAAPAMITAANILNLWWEDNINPDKLHLDPSHSKPTDPAKVAAWEQARVLAAKERASRFRLFVDAGSLLVNQPTKDSIVEVATFLADKMPSVSHIEYFDPDLGQFAIVTVQEVRNNGKQFHAQLLTNSVSQRPAVEELFTFLDSPRATGSDPAMMANGIGLMTGNPVSMSLDGGLQALMRARGLLKVHGQHMDFLITAEAVENFKLTDADGRICPKKILERMIFVLIKNVVQQQLYAATLQIRELPKEFLENTIQKLEMAATTDAKIEPILTDLKSNVKEFFLDTDDFSTEEWLEVRSWKNASDAFKKSWETKLKNLEIALQGTRKALNALPNHDQLSLDNEFKSLKLKVGQYIASATSNLDFLSFQFADGKGENFLAQGAQVQVETQVQIQAQVEVTVQIETQLEKEIDVMRKMFNGPASNLLAMALPLVESTGNYTAWSVMAEKKPELKSISKHLMEFRRKSVSTFRKNLSVGSKIEKSWKKWEEIWNSNFSGQFYGSENFFRTFNVETTIFHGSQIQADHLLIYWNDSNSEFRCCFLSHYDRSVSIPAIEGGRFTNCYLCTSDGVPEANHAKSNIDSILASEDFKNFFEKAKWMAHFFNGDVTFLERTPEQTLQFFTDLGLPSLDGALRDDWLNAVQTFFCLRAQDPKETLARIYSSSIVKSGKILDAKWAKFLAQLGMPPTSSRIYVDAYFTAMLKSDFPAVLRFMLTVPESAERFEQLKPRMNRALAEAFSKDPKQRTDEEARIVVATDGIALKLLPDLGVSDAVKRQIIEAFSQEKVGEIEDIRIFRYTSEEWRKTNLHLITNRNLIREIYAEKKELKLGEEHFSNQQLEQLEPIELKNLSNARIKQIQHFPLARKLEPAKRKLLNFQGNSPSFLEDSIKAFGADLVLHLIPYEKVKALKDAEAIKICFEYYVKNNNWPKTNSALFTEEQLLTVSSEALTELPERYFKFIRTDALINHLKNESLAHLPDATIQSTTNPALIQKLWEIGNQFKFKFTERQMEKLRTDQMGTIPDQRIGKIRYSELVKKLPPGKLEHIDDSQYQHITAQQIRKIYKHEFLERICESDPKRMEDADDYQLALFTPDKLKSLSKDRVSEITLATVINKLSNDQLQHVKFGELDQAQCLYLSDKTIETFTCDYIKTISSKFLIKRMFTYYSDKKWPANTEYLKLFPDEFFEHLDERDLYAIPEARVSHTESEKAMVRLSNTQLQWIPMDEAKFSKFTTGSLLQRFWALGEKFQKFFTDEQLNALTDSSLAQIDGDRIKKFKNPHLIGKLPPKQICHLENEQFRHIIGRQLNGITDGNTLKRIFSNRRDLLNNFSDDQLVAIECGEDEFTGFTNERINAMREIKIVKKLSDGQMKHINWDFFRDEEVVILLKMRDSIFKQIPQARVGKIKDKNLAEICICCYNKNNSWPTRGILFSDEFLEGLESEVIHLLPSQKVASIKSPSLAARLSDDQIQYIKMDVFQKITDGNFVRRAWKLEKGPNKAEIFTDLQLTELTDEMMEEIDPKRLKKIQDLGLLAKLPPKQVSHLEDTQLLKLGKEQLSKLDNNRIAAITNPQLIIKLSPQQIGDLKDFSLQHIVAAQLEGISNIPTLKRISIHREDLLEKFSDEQILSIKFPPDKLGFNRIRSVENFEIVKGLQPIKMQYVNWELFSDTQIGELQDDAIARIPDGRVKEIKNCKIIARYVLQYKGERWPSKETITDEQLDVIEDTKILGSMPSHRVSRIELPTLAMKLTCQQLQSIKSAVFCEISDEAFLRKTWSTTPLREKFADKQLLKLTEEMLRQIDQNQIANIKDVDLIKKLPWEQITHLADGQLRHVTKTQLAKIDDNNLLKRIFTNAESLRDIFADVQLLKLGRSKLSGISGGRVGKIANPQLTVRLSKQQIPHLADGQLGCVTEAQLGEIDESTTLNRIFEHGEALRNKFTDAQLLQLETGKLSQLNSTRIGEISDRRLVGKLTKQQIPHLADEQFKHVTEAQLTEINESATLDRIFEHREALRNKFNDEQLLKLNIKKLSQLNSTRIGEISDQRLVGKLTKQQIPHLADGQLEHVTKTQLDEIDDEKLLNRIFKYNAVLRDEFSDSQLSKLGDDQLQNVTPERVKTIAQGDLVERLWTAAPDLRKHFSARQALTLSDTSFSQTNGETFQAWTSSWNLSDRDSGNVVLKMFRTLNVETGGGRSEELSAYFGKPPSGERDTQRSALPTLLKKICDGGCQGIRVRRGPALWALSSAKSCEDETLKKTFVETVLLVEKSSFIASLSLVDVLNNGWIFPAAGEEPPEDPPGQADDPQGAAGAKDANLPQDLQTIEHFRNVVDSLESKLPRTSEQLDDEGNVLAMRLVKVADPSEENPNKVVDQALIRLVLEENALENPNDKVEEYIHSKKIQNHFNEDRVALGLRTTTQRVLLGLSISLAALCAAMLVLGGLGLCGVLTVGVAFIYASGTMALIFLLTSITLGIYSRPSKAVAE